MVCGSRLVPCQKSRKPSIFLLKHSKVGCGRTRQVEVDIALVAQQKVPVPEIWRVLYVNPLVTIPAIQTARTGRDQVRQQPGNKHQRYVYRDFLSLDRTIWHQNLSCCAEANSIPIKQTNLQFCRGFR